MQTMSGQGTGASAMSGTGTAGFGPGSTLGASTGTGAMSSMAPEPARQRRRQRRDEQRLRLGVFTALRLYVQGRRDGRRGLPARSDTGMYTSPFIARQLDEHRQFCAVSRLRCDQKLAQLRQKIVRLEKEQSLLESVLDETESLLKRQRADFKPAAQPLRASGEQKLDATLLCGRRQAEFEKGLEPLTTRAASARLALLEKQVEHATILAIIEEEERLSQRNRERHARRTERKITAYWQAALTVYQSTKPYERLPLHPHPLSTPWQQDEAAPRQ